MAQREQWIPAFAGMTVGWLGGYFQRNHPCSLATCTPRDENWPEPRTGNHKGCPYGRLAGGYFQRNGGDDAGDSSQRARRA